MCKNIAIILPQCYEPNSGGVQRSTFKLAEIFKKNGFNVVIVSLSKNQDEGLNRQDISVYSCTTEERLSWICQRHNIHLVINQAGYSLSITKFVLRSTKGTNLVSTLRINPLNFYDNHRFIIKNILDKNKLSFVQNDFLNKIILKWHILKQRYELGYIIKHSDAFILLSKRFKRELYQLAPSLKQYNHKIFGISNPFEAPERKVNGTDRKNAFLYVGRLEINQKRVDLLLEIWKELHKKLGDWEFWVVGSGSASEFMKEYCENEFMDRVKFFGKQDPEPFYKQAKVFHLTSAFEGFGNVLVEAQSYGCVPILFESYSAALDIVTHGSDGFLVRPFDIDGYIQESLRLANDTELLQRLGEKAHQKAKQFSFEATYEKWHDVFRSI